jgi:hypothetical protein
VDLQTSDYLHVTLSPLIILFLSVGKPPGSVSTVLFSLVVLHLPFLSNAALNLGFIFNHRLTLPEQIYSLSKSCFNHIGLHILLYVRPVQAVLNYSTARTVAILLPQYTSQPSLLVLPFTSTALLHHPVSSLKLFNRSFCHPAPRFWNQIPLHLRPCSLRFSSHALPACDNSPSSDIHSLLFYLIHKPISFCNPFQVGKFPP